MVMNYELESSLKKSASKSFSLLFSPRSVAVIGASENPGAGLNVIENLKLIGFEGKVYPVNPRRSSILGLPCYPSVSSIPDEVDMAAIVLSSEKVFPILEECAAKGVKAAWAFASGFAESGEQGVKLQEKLRAFCLDQGILFCGPNCVGLVNLDSSFAAFSAPLNQHLRKGKLGAIIQSGSVCLALTNSNREIGFSKIISSGNEAVLDATDYMEYLLDDPDTEVIALFIESFRKPERLFPISEKARSLNKPIVLVKVGRSELAQRATAAHTAALAGSDRVHDAAFRQLGFIRVGDLDELLETCELLLKCKGSLPKSNNVGLITVSGGEIGLIADISEGLSFRYPALSSEAQEKLRQVLPPFTNISNPLDAWGSGDLENTYPPAMEILAREPEMDMLLVSLDATADLSEKQSQQYLTIAKAAAEVKRNHSRTVAFFSNVSGGFDPRIRSVLEEAQIPFLKGARESLKAVDNLFRYSEVIKRGKRHFLGVSVDHEEAREIISGKAGFLKEDEAKRVLEAYGIKRPKEVVVRSLEEALEAASSIGFPVVLKIQSTSILHKTDAGGVALNLANEKELERAFDKMARSPQGAEEFLISQMVEGQVAEAILGISEDPFFGPVVVFGSGGILVELIQDSSLRLPPLGQEEALEMVRETKCYKLISGFRGRPEGDIEELCRALISIGQLAMDYKGRIKALDINPLFIMPKGQGIVAIDALMELR